MARATRQLTDMPVLYEDILEVRSTSSAGKVSGTADPRLPITPAQLEARVWVRGALTSWTLFVVAGRQVNRPPDTVAALCAFLRRHLLWLAADDRAAEFAGKVNDLHRQARQVAYPSPPDRTYIGECPYHVLDGDGLLQVCGERVYAYPGRPDVECPACGTRELVAEWQRVIVGRAGGQVTARTLVALLSARYMTPVPINTLYSWVHKGRVTPVGPGVFDFETVVAYTDTVTRPVSA